MCWSILVVQSLRVSHVTVASSDLKSVPRVPVAQQALKRHLQDSQSAVNVCKELYVIQRQLLEQLRRAFMKLMASCSPVPSRRDA